MGRGGRLDAHGARVYLMFRLACEVARLYPTENTFGGDPELPRRSSGGCAACERLGERRVRPSSKECSACSSKLWTSTRRRLNFELDNVVSYGVTLGVR